MTIPANLAQAGGELAALLREGLQLAVVGMAVVAFALSLTAIVIALLNRFAKRRLHPDPTSTAKKHTTPADPNTPANHLHVVLAAAATAVLQRPVRITCAQKANEHGSRR